MKILVAEDNPLMANTIIRFIGRIVGSLPCITTCRNGREAVRLFQADRYEWVLLDIEMEEMDGLCATRLILEKDPTARVIIVTQYEDAEYRQEASKAGAVGYVLKDNLYDLTQYLGT